MSDLQPDFLTKRVQEESSYSIDVIPIKYNIRKSKLAKLGETVHSTSGVSSLSSESKCPPRFKGPNCGGRMPDVHQSTHLLHNMKKFSQTGQFMPAGPRLLLTTNN